MSKTKDDMMKNPPIDEPADKVWNLSLVEKLAQVQQKLVAPKGQKNTFGNYKYRSCEDILNALKPLQNEFGFIVLLTDKIINIGDRYYVEATASIKDTASGGAIQVVGLAREAENKKGMDAAQVTGSASSYARKYALNGLFMIDDTQDADAHAPTKAKKASKSTEPTAKQMGMIATLCGTRWVGEIDPRGILKSLLVKANLLEKDTDSLKVISKNHVSIIIDIMSNTSEMAQDDDLGRAIYNACWEE